MLALLVAGLLATVSAFAQSRGTVEIVAFNKENQTVKDLTAADVELKLDGRTVTIDSLKLEPKQPPPVLLLIDTSYLAFNNRSLLKDMVSFFIDAKPRYMRMALATINEAQQFLSPFQTSSDELVNTLQKVKFGGLAPVSDNILSALKYYRLETKSSEDPRRVLITFSDGSDDSHQSNMAQVRKALADGGFVYYEINHVKAMKPLFDFKYFDKDLIQLAEETGGRAFRLEDLDSVGTVAREIYDRETMTYVATIAGENKPSSTDRNHFKVRSRRKDLHLEVVSVR